MIQAQKQIRKKIQDLLQLLLSQNIHVFCGGFRTGCSAAVQTSVSGRSFFGASVKHDQCSSFMQLWEWFHDFVIIFFLKSIFFLISNHPLGSPCVSPLNMGIICAEDFVWLQNQSILSCSVVTLVSPTPVYRDPFNLENLWLRNSFGCQREILNNWTSSGFSHNHKHQSHVLSTNAVADERSYEICLVSICSSHFAHKWFWKSETWWTCQKTV